MGPRRAHALPPRSFAYAKPFALARRSAEVPTSCARFRSGFRSQLLVDLGFGREPILDLSSRFEVAALRAKVRGHSDHLLPLFCARQVHRDLAAGFRGLVAPVFLHATSPQYPLAAL